ncbi:MAG: hypothetical protein ACP5VS_13130 [Desulfomonilaceae bacterium]
MNIKRILIFSFFIFVSTVYNSMATNITGRWEASVMGHHVKAVAEQKGQKLSGVAYLYDLLGHKSTWHFNGTVNGIDVKAAHHSGHQFVGKVINDGKMSGVLSTNNGFHIPLDIHSVK